MVRGKFVASYLNTRASSGAHMSGSVIQNKCDKHSSNLPANQKHNVYTHNQRDAILGAAWCFKVLEKTVAFISRRAHAKLHTSMTSRKKWYKFLNNSQMHSVHLESFLVLHFHFSGYSLMTHRRHHTIFSVGLLNPFCRLQRVPLTVCRIFVILKCPLTI